MARTAFTELVFFRYEGDETKDIPLRIHPSAVRYQQQSKGGPVDTLGGYYVDRIYSTDPQYSGRALADLTLEATTGIAYRKDLNRIKWIWEHQNDLKADGKPVDVYFYDLIKDPAFQSIQRDAERIFLVWINNFAFDETVQSPGEIRFTFRCKVLRDLLGVLDPEPPADANSLPRLESLNATSPLGQIPSLDGARFSLTRLPL